MTTTIDDRVDAIFRSLEDMSPSSMQVFSAALDLAGEPLLWFAAPVRRYAGDRAADYAAPNPLARISMRQAITKAATEGSLLSKLADAREPFWVAVGDALVVVAGDLLPLHASQ